MKGHINNGKDETAVLGLLKSKLEKFSSENIFAIKFMFKNMYITQEKCAFTRD